MAVQNKKSRSKRTWQDNADEFATLDKGEGWPFARLVACSVEKGAANGRPRKTSATAEVSEKVSAEEFARRAGTSGDRVLRYLTAWDKAAAKGWCQASADLTPADASTVMEPEHKWDEVYDARAAGGRPRDSKAQDAVTIIDRRGAAAVVDEMTSAQQAEVAKEALRRPGVAKQVLKEDKKVLETVVEAAADATIGEDRTHREVANPQPKWRQVLGDFYSSGRSLHGMIADLRKQGQTNEAALAEDEFRRALDEILGLVGLQVPDTLEGIER